MVATCNHVYNRPLFFSVALSVTATSVFCGRARVDAYLYIVAGNLCHLLQDGSAIYPALQLPHLV
jgi:hypothetical protein